MTTDTRTPSPATPSPVAEGRHSPFVFNEELSTKLQGLRADMPKEAKSALVRECIDMLRKHSDSLSSQAPKPASAGGEVVITTNESGTVCYAVTRQDDEGRILSVIWKAPPTESLDLDILFDQWWLANCKTRYRESVARAAFEAGYRANAIAAEADTAKENDRLAPSEVRGKYKGKLSSVDEFLADRLAPIEARGVVTDYLAEALKTAKRVRIFVDMPEPEAGYFILMKPAEFATLRARESAPAVEGTKMDFHIAFGLCEEGLIEWKSKDHNRRWWKKIDGTPIPNDLLVCIAQQFVEAAMPPPSVATGCAGEVTEEMVSNAMMAYQAAAGTDGPVFGDSSRCMRAALEYALSQPARAAGET